MKYINLLLIFSLLISCELQQKDESSSMKKNQLESENISITFHPIEQLATDFKFTEGPAPDKNGNVYFTDIPEAKIYIWTNRNELQLFRENSGGANGLFFDRGGQLFVCEGYEGRISTTLAEGSQKIIADSFNDTRFNQPNDVWVHLNGDVYFTDPYYGADEENIPQDGMHVYVIKNTSKDIKRVTKDLIKPNGIIGTPNGKKLYITDQEASKTFCYDIEEDGMLTNKRLFVDAGGDGMTIDKQGNIYLTTNGKMAVEIFNPKGELITSIPVPEQPSNVSFGGEKRNELYITARTSLYRVIINSEGAY